jgi:hypothetical protein
MDLLSLHHGTHVLLSYDGGISGDSILCKFTGCYQKTNPV